MSENKKVTFKYDSTSYKVLSYMKMVNKPVTLKNVMNIFRGKFRHSGDAKKTMNVLIRNSCVNQISIDSYMITQKGLDVIRLNGKKQHLLVLRSSGL
jgi:hypothetical protein